MNALVLLACLLSAAEPDSLRRLELERALAAFSAAFHDSPLPSSGD